LQELFSSSLYRGGTNVAEGGPDAGAPASIIMQINSIIFELVMAELPAVGALNAGEAETEQLRVQAKQTKVLVVPQGGSSVLAGYERLFTYAEEVQSKLPVGTDVTLGDMQFAACSYAGESLPKHTSYSL
jgi:hypothetical protein